MSRCTFILTVALELIAIVCVNTAVSTPVHGDDKPVADEQRPWIASLTEGIAQARRLNQPIFVRVGRDDCAWCRKLDAEIQRPEAQAELARWTLVNLDSERSANDIGSFAVGGVPALRALSSEGRLVASHDGYLPAERLVAWLGEHHVTATRGPAAELSATDAPSAVGVIRLVAEMKGREPALREAAVRRLLPHPGLAAVAVTETFVAGPLQFRLAALELLQAWKAPLGDLDPWRPETLTEGRLNALREWAAALSSAAHEINTVITDAEREGARQEMARMIDGSETEAAAARERLARYGRALLPDVHAKLRQAATDLARERLTALRYRLVARDALILGWGGGLERLAATAAETRHQAVQELARRAGPGDEALLLELFSDPDALVREFSLGALHAIAGKGASAALVGLLADPDPNVRAAVLKQLAEKPAAGLVSKIAEYIAGETDVDLVVHGVRALRAAKSKAAAEPLLKLLEHASWRVRAEAAESLHEVVSNSASLGSDRDSLRADAYAAFIRLLDDPDGFVVSRAMKGLKGADTLAAVAPMVAAANKHTELAAEAVQILNGGSKMRQASVPHLRDFGTHASAEVRAAAITALCTADSDVEKDLRTALRDKESAVRRAAAKAFTQILGQQRAAVADAKSFDFDQWLSEFRAGKHRPRWTGKTVEELTPLLRAETREERLAAALPLVALGREDENLPILLDIARVQPDLIAEVGAASAWLAWDKRESFFKQILELKPPADDLAGAVDAFRGTRDERALPILWEMTARVDMTDKLASEIAEAIAVTATGTRQPYDEIKSESDRKAAEKVAKDRVQSGPDLQRTIALVLLARVSQDDAAAAAREMLAQPDVSPQLREDAFRILLLCAPKAEGRKETLAAIEGNDPRLRDVATSYLAVGAAMLTQLRNQSLYVYVRNPSLQQGNAVGTGQPFVPEAPRGLKADTLRPILRSTNSGTAAQAGYLLTLLGEPEGLGPLVAHWREHGKSEDAWRMLVCRAIVALGDDRNVTILEEIYRGFSEEKVISNYQVREFYWTIRGLEGPSALALRKRIRQEVGMENLR